MTEHYLNSSEACQYLGIKNVNSLYGYIRSGKLKAYRMGDGDDNPKSRHHYRFTIEELDRFVVGKHIGTQT